MKIKKLQLKNFRLFRDLEVKFADDNLTVLIGENGSGKSAVLDALALWLSRYILHNTIGRYSYEDGWQLSQQDITKNEDYSSVKVFVDSGDNKKYKADVNFKVEAKRRALHRDFTMEPKVSYEGRPASIYNDDGSASVPILTYYRIGRTSTSSSKLDKLFVGGRNHSAFQTYNNSLILAISSFQDFASWFVAKENIENQEKVQTENLDYKLPDLENVRKAVEQLVAEFPKSKLGRIRVERSNSAALREFDTQEKAESILTIEKAGIFIPLENLSSGEKSILLLVADIARRLCIANPKGDPLQGNGVVLIDEVELHLHPAWQRTILASLRTIFPNVQFIVTTHSPQVLSKVHDENILIIEDGEVISAADPFGRDSNSILEELMGTPERPAEAEELLKDIFAQLAEKEIDFDKVEISIENLKEFVTEDDPVFLRLANIIKRKKLVAAS